MKHNDRQPVVTGIHVRPIGQYYIRSGSSGPWRYADLWLYGFVLAELTQLVHSR